MPRTKVHSLKRKKRRFTGNQYTKKGNSSTKTVPITEESIEKSESSSGDEEHAVGSEKSQKFKSMPASVRKMDVESDDSSNESSEYESSNPEGFRFVDMCVLASVFQVLLWPSCKRGTLSLEEDEESKMGLASLLILKCSAGKCSFHHSFYTSAKKPNKQAFEVNRRVVLAMRNNWCESPRTCQVYRRDEHVIPNE